MARAGQLRKHLETAEFTAQEVALASNNVSLPLEALRREITPVGLHYTLSHFDLPFLAADDFRLRVGGSVERPFEITLAELQRLPAVTQRVTLECAGNGRAAMMPRYPSMPWTHGAVGTADWTGVPLRVLLERAGLRSGTVDVVFSGADRGIDGGIEQAFARSLNVEQALADGVLVAWAMNGQPLPPQHGAPLRLVVPGWYGMASVKWLTSIDASPKRFEGHQQAVVYRLRQVREESGEPIERIRVKSLMAPPGITDWYSRERIVAAGATVLEGRAWSGNGAIRRVEVLADGRWRDAQLAPPTGRWAWQHWRIDWQATPGEHELACRATDDSGDTQPLEPAWNYNGMCNNAVQRLRVTVTSDDAPAGDPRGPQNEESKR